MSETILTQQVLDELAFLKEKILKIETEVGEINDDLHQVRPEYLRKLKKSMRAGSFQERILRKSLN